MARALPQIKEAVTAQVVETLSSQPAAKPTAKPKKPGSSPRPSREGTVATTRNGGRLPRSNQRVRSSSVKSTSRAKVVRVGCCHDVGRRTAGSMSDVKSASDLTSPRLRRSCGSNVRLWAKVRPGDVNELDFAWALAHTRTTARSHGRAGVYILPKGIRVYPSIQTRYTREKGLSHQFCKRPLHQGQHHRQGRATRLGNRGSLHLGNREPSRA